MKRIRTLISISLAIVLLLIPGVALADDPPDEDNNNAPFEFGLGVVAEGDITGRMEFESGGKTTLFVNDQDFDEMATKNDLVAATQGQVQHEDFVCGGSRMAIKEINRVLEILYINQLLISEGLEMEIVLSEEEAEQLEKWLSNLTAYVYSQDRVAETQKDAIVFLSGKVDELTETANHKVTDLTERQAELMNEQITMRAEYDFKLLLIAISAFIIIVVLGIIAHRARRRA